MEIFTKAVAGRAERRLSWVHTIAADAVKNVLGVHLGKTTVSVHEQDGETSVEITVHCDIWCRDEKETLVLQTTAQSVFAVDVPTTDPIVGQRKIQISLADSPRSTGIKVAENQLLLNLEVDVSLEVVGQVRLWVRTGDPNALLQSLPQPPVIAPPEPQVETADGGTIRERGRARGR